MDAQYPQVVWLFDPGSDADSGPVMCGVDDLSSLVEQALTVGGLTHLGIEGTIERSRAGGGFELVARSGPGSGAAGRLALTAVDGLAIQVGSRMRAWGWLRCSPAGALELEVEDLHVIGER
jgi:hypothetical protein